MTLLTTIVRDAFRESNLIAISANPTDAEQDEGLRLLNRFVLSLFGNEAGEELLSIPIGRTNISRPSGYPGYDGQPDGDWFVPVNTRLILNLSSPETVYLHPRPHDGARFAFIDKSGDLSTYNLVVDANGYTLEGIAVNTFDTDDLVAEYFFRADTGNWARVYSLLIDDSSPFPEEFDDLLVIGLAMRLNPRNGVAINAQSVEAYKATLRKFKSQYRQDIQVGVEEGILRTPGIRRERYGRYGLHSSDAMFKSGRPY